MIPCLFTLSHSNGAVSCHLYGVIVDFVIGVLVGTIFTFEGDVFLGDFVGIFPVKVDAMV